MRISLLQTNAEFKNAWSYTYIAEYIHEWCSSEYKDILPSHFRWRLLPQRNLNLHGCQNEQPHDLRLYFMVSAL